MARLIWSILFLTTLGSLAFILLTDWKPKGHSIESLPITGGVYHAGLASELSTLDPALATDSPSGWCMIQLFDGLVRFQANVEDSVGPAIASSWDISPDHKQYTFHLRDDVCFHDWIVTDELGTRLPTKCKGRAVTSEDFRYSFERVLDPKTGSPRSLIFEVLEGAKEFMKGKASHVRGLLTPDPRTLTIRLVQPFKPFLKTLTMASALVVPREDIEQLGPRFSTAPCGTGAFRFGGYRGKRGQPGRELSLLANERYFCKRPHLNQVVFHIEANEEKRFQMFLSGRLHHSVIPDPDYDRLGDSEALGIIKTPEVSRLGVYYYGMNVQRPPFDSADIRRALSHAVDREAIKKYIKSDRVDVAVGPLPPALRHKHPFSADRTGSTLSPTAFNLTRAGELLDRAGYRIDPTIGLRTGFPVLPLDVPNGEEHVRIAKAIQANLADLGIESLIRTRSLPVHLEHLRRGDSLIFRLGWVADYKDADSFLYYNFHSRNIGTSNYSRYANPMVDRLLDEARQAADQHRRDDLYQQIEETLVEDAVWINLFYLKTAIVRQPIVQELNLSEFGEHTIAFREVWLNIPRSAP